MKFLKKFEFGHVLEKSLILVKISEKFRFFRKFRKKIDFVKFYVKMHFFFENFEKFRFWSNFRKILISVKIYEKHRFFRKFGKFRFCQISKKISFWSKLAKMSKNFDLGQISEKFGCVAIFQISILVKISKNFRFW